MKKKSLCINFCANHGVYAISIDDKDGGQRVTPSKCCGTWDVIESWPLDKRGWLAVSKLALDAAEIADGQNS